MLDGAATRLDVLDREDLPHHAAVMGQYLREQLTERVGDDVRDVRGEGLMVGIEVKRGANRLLRDLALNHQVLALPAGRTVLRLLPPLVVDEQECDAVVDAIEAVVS